MKVVRSWNQSYVTSPIAVQVVQDTATGRFSLLEILNAPRGTPVTQRKKREAAEAFAGEDPVNDGRLRPEVGRNKAARLPARTKKAVPATSFHAQPAPHVQERDDWDMLASETSSCASEHSTNTCDSSASSGQSSRVTRSRSRSLASSMRVRADSVDLDGLSNYMGMVTIDEDSMSGNYLHT